MTGILNTTGTTAVAFDTDVPTTLRGAISTMQNLGEVPSAWCLNPVDAQNIDLTRWGTQGGFLSGGYEHDTGNGFGTSAKIFGPDNISRVVTPHLPQGTALLADFDQLLLVFQQYMRLDVDAYSGFDKNAVRFRPKLRVVGRRFLWLSLGIRGFWRVSEQAAEAAQRVALGVVAGGGLGVGAC